MKDWPLDFSGIAKALFIDNTFVSILWFIFIFFYLLLCVISYLVVIVIIHNRII
jgi:phage shock protein PspC (stress-responsive transcriptional regulator)